MLAGLSTSVYSNEKQNSFLAVFPLRMAPPKPDNNTMTNNMLLLDVNIQQYHIKYKKMLQKPLDSGEIKTLL